MKITEINDLPQLTSLQDSWDSLLVGGNYSVFATWTWMSTWWAHFGSGRKLVLLVAEENGEIVGIAPLMYLVESLFGLRRGKLEFVGTPESDYNCFLFKENSNKEQIFESFLHYLNGLQENWSFANLTDIPETAECLPFLQAASTVKQGTKCSYLPLPESYATFLKQLTSNQRCTINKQRRKVERNFKAEFVDYSSLPLCIEGLKIVMDLHQKRWAAVGVKGAFSDPKIRSFHLDVVPALARKNMLGLYILKLDGKPVSGSYGFRYGPKYYGYLPGFDPDYSAFGVGSVLVPHLIEESIKNGLTELDLMRGDENYKERWNAIPRWNYHAILNRSRFLGNFRNKITENFWFKTKAAKFLINTTLQRN